jgi:hypothetical protein
VGLSCVAVYLVAAAPAMLSTLALIFVWVALAALFAAGIVYGGGNQRAFCIGAMFPAGATAFALVWILFGWLANDAPDDTALRRLTEYLGHSFPFRLWSVIGWPMIAIAGAASLTGRMVFAPKVDPARVLQAAGSASPEHQRAD